MLAQRRRRFASIGSALGREELAAGMCVITGRPDTVTRSDPSPGENEVSATASAQEQLLQAVCCSAKGEGNDSLLCKVRRQQLLTFQVISCCLLALRCGMVIGTVAEYYPSLSNATPYEVLTFWPSVPIIFVFFYQFHQQIKYHLLSVLKIKRDIDLQIMSRPTMPPQLRIIVS